MANKSVLFMFLILPNVMHVYTIHVESFFACFFLHLISRISRMLVLCKLCWIMETSELNTQVPESTLLITMPLPRHVM